MLSATMATSTTMALISIPITRAGLIRFNLLPFLGGQKLYPSSAGSFAWASQNRSGLF